MMLPTAKKSVKADFQIDFARGWVYNIFYTEGFGED